MQAYEQQQRLQAKIMVARDSVLSIRAALRSLPEDSAFRVDILQAHAAAVARRDRLEDRYVALYA